MAVWTNHIQHSDFGHCSCAEWHFQCGGRCKGKKGNSNTNERIELLKEVTTLFPERKIAYLTADREFLGHDWFGYLLKHPTLPFRIRIRASDCLSDGRQSLKASVAKAHLKPQQTQVLPKRRRLWGYWLYVAALRLEDNELLVERHSQFSRNC